MATISKILHKKSNVVTNGNPKLPSTSQLEYGEIAINYAKGYETISIKNDKNEIVTFKSGGGSVDGSIDTSNFVTTNSNAELNNVSLSRLTFKTNEAWIDSNGGVCDVVISDSIRSIGHDTGKWLIENDTANAYFNRVQTDYVTSQTSLMISSEDDLGSIEINNGRGSKIGLDTEGEKQISLDTSTIYLNASNDVYVGSKASFHTRNIVNNTLILNCSDNNFNYIKDGDIAIACRNDIDNAIYLKDMVSIGGEPGVDMPISPLMIFGNYNHPNYGTISLFADVGGAYFGGKVTCDSVVQSSDKNFKDIKDDVTLSLEDIANASAVKFTWKDRDDESVHVGTIAQDWQKILPEAVSEGDNGKLGLDYSGANMVATISLAKEVLNQKKVIEEQNARIEKLEKLVNELLGK